jgi:hypothetical protein
MIDRLTADNSGSIREHVNFIGKLRTPTNVAFSLMVTAEIHLFNTSYLSGNLGIEMSSYS